MVWRKLSEEELRLARTWYAVDGESPREIARRLGRDKSTLTRLLVKRTPRKSQGRRSVLSTGQVDRIEAKLREKVAKAAGRYEVTVSMVRKAARVKASSRTVLKALHKRGVYFRRLREKPLLTEADVRDRLAFARKYHKKPASWWQQHIHAAIDVKHFQVFLSGHARARAAQEGTRGAYRRRAQGLDTPYVKSGSRMKYNPGARGVQVFAAVGNGKVLVWEYLDQQRWCGDAAAALYTGPLAKKLRTEYPDRSSWAVLEDNDPSGFKSSKGMRAKRAAGIKAFEIPRRSPSLNVCDYFLWSHVNKKMRSQEQQWPAGRTETRKQYLQRLRRTALRIPRDVLNNAMADMHRRCQRLLAASGQHFEEGGR